MPPHVLPGPLTGDVVLMVPSVLTKLQTTHRDVHLMDPEKRAQYEHGIPRFAVVFSGTKCDIVPKSPGGGRLMVKHMHEVVDQLCMNHLTLPDVQDKAVFLIKSSLSGELMESNMEIIEVAEACPDKIHCLSVLLLNKFLAGYEEMFAMAAYARKLQWHRWMPKANVNADMVAIRRLLFEGVVIERETVEQIVEKRYKVMTEEDSFAWLLARLPASILAWERRARVRLQDVECTRRFLVGCRAGVW